MSKKYRHTTIMLLIFSIILLIVEIIVVIKFFTKEESNEITYNQEISTNIDYNLSNLKDTNDSDSTPKISDYSNNIRSNIYTSSRSLYERTSLEEENNENNKNNEQKSEIKNPTINSNLNTIKTQESENSEENNLENSNKINETNSEKTTQNGNNNTNDNISTDNEKKENRTNNNTVSENKNTNNGTNTASVNKKKTSTKKQNNASTTTIPQDAIGNITIPKTGVNLPIMKTVTLHNMDTATCFLYSTGTLNKSGTTVIIGHNYQNGKLFSNNNKLKKGDKIYITTQDGTKKEYTIYDKFITSDDDISYIKRNTDNSPQIALSSCTDDEKNRIIILAK